MIRLLANSPVILGAYLRFNEAFETTKITPKLRGLITAAVSEINGCDYTLSIAYALGRQEGLTKDELGAARHVEANEPRAAAALRFAAETVRERGHVPASEVEKLRQAGFSDEEIVEIIGLISLNIFRNYFNLLAGTEVDFPLVFDPLLKQTPREAADPALKLLLEPEFEGVTGALFSRIKRFKPVAPTAHALDREEGRRLWELSERLVAKGQTTWLPLSKNPP